MSPRRLPGPLDRLNGDARRRVRRVVDAVAAPLGSWREARDPSVVAVTFDDGPDPLVTPALLDALDAHAARSTFFLLVEQAERHPELARAIAARGHEIGLHGLDHRPLPPMGGPRAHADLVEARSRLEAGVARPLRWYRPPYGKQTFATWLAARRAGLDVVVWSDDAADWLDDELAVVTGRALGALRPGGILLLHERVEPGPGGEPVHTGFDRPALVDAVLGDAAARGLSPVTVGDLVRAGGRRSLWWRR
jgi:peptidoglycan/xylan/chitin deacetylase (PgdA/CDA1 family)